MPNCFALNDNKMMSYAGAGFSGHIGLHYIIPPEGVNFYYILLHYLRICMNFCFFATNQNASAMDKNIEFRNVVEKCVLFTGAILASFMPVAAQYFSLVPSKEILKGDVASYEVETIGIMVLTSIADTRGIMSGKVDTVSSRAGSMVHITLDNQGNEIERLIYLHDSPMVIPSGMNSDVPSTPVQKPAADNRKPDTKVLYAYYDNGRLKQRQVFQYWEYEGHETLLAQEAYEYVDDEGGRIRRKIIRTIQGNETVETYYRTGEKIDSVEIVRKINGSESRQLDKYLYLDDNGSVLIYDGNARGMKMIESNIYDSKGRLSVHTNDKNVDCNTFYYDNGEVFMTSDVDSDGSLRWVIYDSYKFDDHGNWIYRIAHTLIPSTSTPDGGMVGGKLSASSVITRTITYR